MAQRLTTIGFDADDTLWHNERFFQMTQAHFAELLSEFTDKTSLMERLLAAEKRNIEHYGFGVKGFTLSMIETAIDVTDGQVATPVIAEILDAGREMLRHPVDLLPHAREAVECARQTHRIVLITKGDLLDQERKLAQSGLGDLFDGVEIVSDKTAETYVDIFARHGAGPDKGMMVGNSLRSDVLPMIEAGGWGVFVPHEHAWDLEQAAPPRDDARYKALPSLADLAPLIGHIESL
ncbi:HAD family hydrolase [Roseobacter sinensis]|uniref:HAD family hydrolase n=1 Tax=Roseobacter sinensis TaxID=2931391 RepID=A0ABT3BDT7_9RHOB|nr:HAD family hydrolase [Roseobacter sp. WL0113]MCV3271743.1 HAD family hydrolase [Roseobacter sp. WL0113]